MTDQASADGLYMVDDTSDDPCEPNLYGFCRYCGQDMTPASWRDQEMARRVADGINSSAESAAWSVDYGAGYSAGQADARRHVKRDYSGACEAWSAGYDRAWTFTLAHS